MSDIAGTTRSQTQFLRSFRTHPAGPPADLWPSPTILRRWLRRPTFRAALGSLVSTLRYEADLRLAYASAAASRHLQQDSLTPATPDAPARPHLLARDLLKLSHTRQRFAPPPPPVPPRFDDALEFLKTIHPEIKLGEALDYYQRQCIPDEEPVTNNK